MKINIKDLKVGQIVFLVPSDRQRSKDKEPVEYYITKIGRKHLEVKKPGLEHWDGVKFDMTNDMRHVSQYSADWTIYFSKQEILDAQEVELLGSALRTIFGGWGTLKISLDKLRRIKAIIDEI